ncbi:lipopolysaccharide biosynthesis protein [Halorientalis marina]|uniref:lipopolysaccharide biosynthesis protein n=1 Tax=Halorientalis marina TaxID=2931976 RepID=UPI001FF6C030|nr:lipopolysaccharide biosynthesis protein [Halorientalis marina]
MLDTLLAKLRSVVASLVPGGGLRERTVKSGIWVTAMNVGDRVLQLGSLVVLARLLSPADFGLMGIALVAIHGLQRFTNLGLDEALIKDRDDDVDDYLDTAWVLNLGRGLLIAGVMFLGAPLIASFTGEPRATPILRVIGISPLLLQLRNPGTVYFKKDLAFEKQFLYTMGGSISNFAVAVTLAVLWQNVWALVFGYIASDLMRTVMSYLLHDYRPWPAFDLDIARKLVDYGKWLTGSRIVLFLINEGDDAIVVWLLGAASLGFYQIAYRFAMAPARELTQIVSSIMFPAYSKLQDDVGALRSAFFKTVKMTTFISFPVGFGIIAVAPTFVAAFFGQRWLPMVPVMQIIAVNGILISFTSAFGSVWMARDRPDYLVKVGLIRLPLMVLAMIPMTRAFGIAGAAAAVVGVYVFPMLPIDIYLVVKTVETTYWRLLSEVVYPLAASLVMGAVVWIAERSLDLGMPFVEFVLLTLLGIAVYVVVAFALERQFDWGIERNVRQMVDAVK